MDTFEEIGMNNSDLSEVYVRVTDIYIDDPKYPYPYITGINRLGMQVRPISLLTNVSGVYCLPAIGDIIKAFRVGISYKTYGEPVTFKFNYFGLEPGGGRINTLKDFYIDSDEGDVYIQGNPVVTAYEAGGGVNLLKNSSFDLVDENISPYYWTNNGLIEVVGNLNYRGKKSLYINLTHDSHAATILSDTLIDCSSDKIVFSGYIKSENLAGLGESYLKVLTQVTGETEYTEKQSICFDVMNTKVMESGWVRYWYPITVLDTDSEHLVESIKVELDFENYPFFEDTFFIENDYRWDFFGERNFDDGLLLINGSLISSESIPTCDSNWSIETVANYLDSPNSGIVFNYQDKDNYFAMVQNGNNIFLNRVVGGIINTDYSGSFEVVSGVDYLLEVKATMDNGYYNYDFCVDGNIIWSFSDSSGGDFQLPTGRFGLITDSSKAKFQYIKAFTDADIWVDKLQIEKGITPTGWEGTIFELIPEGSLVSAQIGSISADDITTGTLTGRTVQTAQEGTFPRAAMYTGTDEHFPHKIITYNQFQEGVEVYDNRMEFHSENIPYGGIIGWLDEKDVYGNSLMLPPVISVNTGAAFFNFRRPNIGGAYPSYDVLSARYLGYMGMGMPAEIFKVKYGAGSDSLERQLPISQWGMVTSQSVSACSTITGDVTFPVRFKGIPRVQVTATDVSGGYKVIVGTTAVSYQQFTYYIHNFDESNIDIAVSWLAMES